MSVELKRAIHKESEIVADSHQTGTLEVHPRARSIWFGGSAGWLIVGFAVVSMLAGLLWNHYVVRYHGADYR